MISSLTLEKISANQKALQNFLATLLGSVLIGLCAQLSIKLPFTPIPIALAPHACLFIALLLGRKLGVYAVAAYLFQGAIGLPVFSNGNSGLLYMMGPSGGYLFGYLAGAVVTGYLAEKTKSSTQTFLALVAGNLTIYFFGSIVLSTFIGFKSAITLGVLPFLIGDLLKIFAVNGLIKRFR